MCKCKRKSTYLWSHHTWFLWMSTSAAVSTYVLFNSTELSAWLGQRQVPVCVTVFSQVLLSVSAEWHQAEAHSHTDEEINSHWWVQLPHSPDKKAVESCFSVVGGGYWLQQLWTCTFAETLNTMCAYLSSITTLQQKYRCQWDVTEKSWPLVMVDSSPD